MNFIRTAFVSSNLKRCLVSHVNSTLRKKLSNECRILKPLVCERKVISSSKPYICKHQVTKVCSRTFHTSSRNDLPPVVWIVLRPVGKVVAALAGRRLRLWWKNLPEDKRTLVRNWVYRNKIRISLIFSSFLALIYVYYYTHLQETPLTARRRFIAFTEKQYEQIADYEYKMIMSQFGDRLLPKSNSMCRTVENVSNRLLLANKDIAQIYGKKWSVCVVDAPNVKNAFVLPTGQIFVFTGMLSCIANDDQLGTVIAHEMSHAILGHAAELLSHAQILDIFVISVICLLWALIPFDSSALFLTWLYHKIVDITLNLPYNRMLELEADQIGLNLAAKACFDIRESVVFWKKMSLKEKEEIEAIFGESEIPQMDFLSTHPSHESRAETIEALLPKAFEVRNSCRCPPLPSVDPRVTFERMKRIQKQKFADKVVVLKQPVRPPGV